MSDFDYGGTRPDGQHERHPGIDQPAQKPKVRPVREQYKHTTCGTVTRMPQHCALTYAVDPKFYGSTFCCGCRKYLPVAEFVWLDDGTTVGS
jgi:hypothetical protein